MQKPHAVPAGNAAGSRGDRGAVGVEYGILIGFIGMAVVAGVTAVGEAAMALFQPALLGLADWLP